MSRARASRVHSARFLFPPSISIIKTCLQHLNIRSTLSTLKTKTNKKLLPGPTRIVTHWGLLSCLFVPTRSCQMDNLARSLQGNLTIWREILTFEMKKYIRSRGKSDYVAPGKIMEPVEEWKNTLFQTLALLISWSLYWIWFDCESNFKGFIPGGFTIIHIIPMKTFNQWIKEDESHLFWYTQCVLLVCCCAFLLFARFAVCLLCFAVDFLFVLFICVRVIS